MENVPPPPASAGWPSRGIKRSHGQISGRAPQNSRRTRSPSILSVTLADYPSTSNTNTNTSSSSSSDTSTPPQRPEVHAGAPTLLRLPSFRELDARRGGGMEDEVTRGASSSFGRAAAAAAAGRLGTLPMGAARRAPRMVEVHRPVIDLTGDEGEEADTRYVRYASDGPLRPNGGETEEDRWRLFRENNARLDPARAPFGQARRGPRFPAEIIDLSGETPRGPPRPYVQQRRPSPDSPEIQFLRERQISPRRRFAGATPPLAAAYPPNILQPTGHVRPIEIPDDDDDDDDFQIIREEIRGDRDIPPVPRGLAGVAGYIDRAFGGRFPHNIDILRNIEEMLPRFHPAQHDVDGLERAHARQRAALSQRVGVVPQYAQFVPPQMDFGIAAFDLRGEGDAQLAREPSVVAILEPPPAGFVRSPVEEDVLVCPGCEGELGVGGDEEVKRQVWLVRKCGHVYCGECAASRNQRVPKKAKEAKNGLVPPPPPLKKCVVAGCGARTSAKQMLQLFL